MKKILCIGEALIDMICTDKGSSLSQGQHFLKKPGGAPTNVAAAVAALGGRAELVAKVGTDPFGEQLIRVMEEFRVSTRWIFRDPAHFTTMAFVSLMENGERDFYFNRGADGQLTSAEVNAIDLKDVSIIHFGSATAFLPGHLQSAYADLLARCRGKEMLISFDPNYRHLLFRDNKASFIEQCWHFLERSHFFKVSDEEALLITGETTLAAAAEVLLEKINSVFAITLGREGALLGYQGKTMIVPGIPVIPVDTTGAGDAFVGAVLYQLGKIPFTEAKELTAGHWQQIIANANKAGAKTCEYMGAMEGLKYLKNLMG